MLFKPQLKSPSVAWKLRCTWEMTNQIHFQSPQSLSAEGALEPGVRRIHHSKRGVVVLGLHPRWVLQWYLENVEVVWASFLRGYEMLEKQVKACDFLWKQWGQLRDVSAVLHCHLVSGWGWWFSKLQIKICLIHSVNLLFLLKLFTYFCCFFNFGSEINYIHLNHLRQQFKKSKFFIE